MNYSLCPSKKITFDKGIVSISDILYTDNSYCSFEKAILPGEYVAEHIVNDAYSAFRIYHNDKDTKTKIAKNKSWKTFIAPHINTSKTIGVFQNMQQLPAKYLKSIPEALSDMATDRIFFYNYPKKKAKVVFFRANNKNYRPYGIQTKGRLVAMDFRLYHNEQIF